MMRRILLPIGLALGDLIALLLAVPVALIVRNFEFPSLYLMSLHVVPFTLLALLSVAVFFSAGLYDKPTALIRRELPGTILGAQVVNILIAAIIFFFVPVFEITPRAILVLYLLVSVAFVTAWRFFALSFSSATREEVLVIADKSDADELLAEFSEKGLVPFRAEFIPLSESGTASFIDAVRHALARNPAYVIADLDDPRMAGVLRELDGYRAAGGRQLEFADFYERIFHRIPVSTLPYRNFLKESNFSFVEDVFKRLFDILISLPLLLLLAVLLPFVFVATRLEGKGPLFIAQERIGKNWRRITVHKFRTMTQNKAASKEWTVEEKNDNKVTRVGALLRRSSIDELPQIFSVFTGELSLVGPRSDIAGLGERLQAEIPLYRARYLVTPGISGWAQVNQRYAPGNISPQSIEESRVRLAYDLYYVKHRSPFLDISITLRTLKTLITRILP